MTVLLTHSLYKELCALQKISYDAQRLAIQKPVSVAHEVQTGYNPEMRQLVAQSHNYATRVMRGTSVGV